MTREEAEASLVPCPLCGAGDTFMIAKPYGLVDITHICDKTSPGTVLLLRAKDIKSAVQGWNRRDG